VTDTIECLDCGYVKLIEPYGSDERIIEAARMSFGGGFRGWDKEEKLLAHLWNNKHTTPFEMAGMIVEVKAPIFIFREWHRHRTQSYNEMSGRYVPLPNENYLPTVDRLMRHSTTNKQAGKASDVELTSDAAFAWLQELAEAYDICERIYQAGLQIGVPKELARLIVPVGRYSAMRANSNLLNWLRFTTLRSDTRDEKAMEEMRVYGNAMRTLLYAHFPRTLQLWENNPF
jgi:thymidylate synthase (FAD)